MNENERKTYWQDGKWRMILDGQERSDEFTQYVAGLENKAAAIIPIMHELAEKVDYENIITQKDMELKQVAHTILSLKSDLAKFTTGEKVPVARIKDAEKLLKKYEQIHGLKYMPYRKLFMATEEFLRAIVRGSD